MAEVTEAAIEAATEAADKVIEEADHIVEVSRRLSGREIRLVLAGVGVGLVIGDLVGGLIRGKRLRTFYAEQAESEIDQMREHFRAKNVAREEKPSLGELKGVVEKAQYTSPKIDSVERKIAEPEDEELSAPETASAIRNVFQDQSQVAEPSEGGWDYPTELTKRIKDQAGKRPYVINVDEQHELDYSETTFTYYEGDDITCDSEDRIVSKPESIIGVDFREKFGHGSDDPNTVYIRNDDLAADIEVIHSANMYSLEIQGLNEEDEFEDQRRNKFDNDDDE